MKRFAGLLLQDGLGGNQLLADAQSLLADAQGQGAAGSAFTGDDHDDRHRKTRHFNQVVGDGLGLPPLFGPDAGIRSGRVDEGHDGPEHWGDLVDEFFICEEGKNQSPIDLSGALPADLPELDFDYRHTGKLIEKNTGHAIQDVVQPGNMLHVQGNSYELKQFHFHSPSEHTVEGRYFPMEVHFVHQDVAGELLVVGFFFVEGDHNLVMDQLPSFRVERGEKPLEQGVDYNELIVGREDYFLYNGSLTTPPCSEGVRWVVMRQPIEASQEQIQHYHDLLGFDNNRPIQPTNARIVLE